jgi:hypothetical protein
MDESTVFYIHQPYSALTKIASLLTSKASKSPWKRAEKFKFSFFFGAKLQNIMF